jgi:hypothetical protein
MTTYASQYGNFASRFLEVRARPIGAMWTCLLGLPPRIRLNVWKLGSAVPRPQLRVAASPSGRKPPLDLRLSGHLRHALTCRRSRALSISRVALDRAVENLLYNRRLLRRGDQSRRPTLATSVGCPCWFRAIAKGHFHPHVGVIIAFLAMQILSHGFVPVPPPEMFPPAHWQSGMPSSRPNSTC